MIQLKQATKGSKLRTSLAFTHVSLNKDLLGIITDGQTSILISRETSIVDWESGSTGILTLGGDDVVGQSLSLDEFGDGMDGNCNYQFALGLLEVNELTSRTS
jgi:hypothetical protein